MPTRRIEHILQQFGDSELQRWLVGQLSVGAFLRSDPGQTWPGTAMNGPRRLWHFAGTRRWVWNQGNEYQAFQEFRSTGPGAGEAAGLNLRITALLRQGESPAGALFKAAGLVGQQNAPSLGAALGPHTGGFAIHSPPGR